MSTFPLKIVTPDGLIYDGQAERLIVRSTTGDLAIMARHINYVTSLGMGKATVISDGKRREAACIGGMLTMISGEANLIATTFEWSEDIDLPRAQHAKEVAQARIVAAKNDERELMLAEAKLRRALVRIGVKS